MTGRRVFVLGLDGATFDIIHRMRAAGRLPAFGRLMQEGAWGRLESIDNMRSAAAWTSFLTGTNPGKHGIYEFYDYLPESYSLRFINAGIRDGQSVWGLLSAHGKKVGVLNVPMTYPAEAVNGFLVAGLDGPSAASPGFAHPPGFMQKLEAQYGPYVIEPGLTGAMVGGRIPEAVRLIREEIEQKIAITRGLMKSEPWDFFISVFRSLDAVQHTFWKYMDPKHPDHQAAEAAQFGTVIDDVYAMIDVFLGELLDTLDADTTLFVMSDHGFGRKVPAGSQINPWLSTRGLLTYRKGDGGAGLLREVYKRVVGRTSRRMKERLWQLFPSLRDRVQSRICFSNIDWRRTRAYSDSLFANVRVNLRGREQQGIVEPGAEYEALITGLIRDLKALRDAKTGEPIVRDVLRKEDCYQGPYMGKAPDLLVRWREDIDISGIDFEGRPPPPSRIGPAVPGEDPRIISGDHHLNGVLLARGPGLRRGAEVSGARLIDLAPTFLHTLGQAVPSDMDGRVLDQLFAAAPAPVQFEDAAPRQGPQGDGAYDAAAEAAMHARLRDLGYVE
ncbi:MAG: alkaline phosphatase family protein [Lentisphaerae bacterium]|nr:alkaline phosphatase family protein [Lentisphaerota bacterium]